MTVAALFNQKNTLPSSELMICFSHLRWDFVFQRPQHLMTRFARQMDVVFWEEADTGADAPAITISRKLGVRVVTPRLPDGLDAEGARAALTTLLDDFLATEPRVAVRWYYTPMMLPFSRQVAATS